MQEAEFKSKLEKFIPALREQLKEVVPIQNLGLKEHAQNFGINVVSMGRIYECMVKLGILEEQHSNPNEFIFVKWKMETDNSSVIRKIIEHFRGRSEIQDLKRYRVSPSTPDTSVQSPKTKRKKSVTKGCLLSVKQQYREAICVPTGEVYFLANSSVQKGYVKNVTIDRTENWEITVTHYAVTYVQDDVQLDIIVDHVFTSIDNLLEFIKKSFK